MCHILEIQDWRVLSNIEKASSSQTIIIFGTKEGANVALKIWPFVSDVACAQGLFKEVEIYQEVTALFNKHWSPNVVLFVDFGVCKAIELEKFGLSVKAPFVGVLGTERIDGISMADALDRDLLPAEVITALIFQVVHSIGTLALAGVRHADLHLGNVMLTNGDPSTPFKADIGGLKYWSVPTNPIAKIYDWDFGDLEQHCERNRKSSFCKRQFDVRGTNPKADLFTFLCSIWMYLGQGDSVRDLIEQWVSPLLLEAGESNGLFEQRGGYPFRLCKGPISDSCPGQVTEELCSGAWIPPDCLMKTPGQILSHPVFQNWSTPPNPEAWGSDLAM